MLGNLRMCQKVFAFWEIEVRRIDNWELFFRKENYFRWLLSQTILSIYRSVNKQKPENKTVYICGLGASVRYEQLSEYLTRSD